MLFRSELRVYESDGLTAYRQLPMIVALPETTEQVSTILRLCHERGIKVVPRGAGTGLSGGALPLADGITLGLAKLNRILDVDLENRSVTAQPGVTNLAITAAVADHGFYYAPDPSSQIACTIGGNVAENSGGIHCLKYGVTTNNLLGLELVLMNGETLRLGGKHFDSGGYDLLGVVTGSEGLLGVITEVTVRILRKPATARALLIGFPSIEAAGECVSLVIAAGIIPGGMEIMDKPAIAATEAFCHAGYPLAVGALPLVPPHRPQVEADHPARAPACRTGANRSVEGEERGSGWPDAEASRRVGPIGGEGPGFRSALRMHHGASSLAQVECALKGFEKALAVGLGDLQAVLNDLHLRGQQVESGLFRRVGAHHLAVQEDAEVTLLLEEGKELCERGLGRNSHGEENESLLIQQIIETPGCDGVGGVGPDEITALGIDRVRTAREEQFEIVVDLGDGPHRRAGGAHVVILLDRDGGRDAVDAINGRLVHAVEKLTDVGREGLHVASLAFSVEGLEGEGGLAGSGGPGDNRELAQGDVEVEALEVVLPRPTNMDGGGAGSGLGLGAGALRGRHGASLRRERRLANGKRSLFELVAREFPGQ